jgi:hypothetical protein
MTDASSLMTVATRSRLVRAIYYEPDANRLCVLTTHGKINIHEGVKVNLVELITGHAHPGHAYLCLRNELGSRKSPYSLSGYSAVRRARRAIQQILN